MSNRRYAEFKKGLKPDGSRPKPGTVDDSSAPMRESHPAKVVAYPKMGGKGVGFPPHGKRVKAYPQGTV